MKKALVLLGLAIVLAGALVVGFPSRSMRLDSIGEIVKPEKIDTALAFLTYNVAVWAFFLTLIVMFLTAMTLRAPLIESARARQDEAEARKLDAKEKRTERSLDLLRILAAFDPKTRRPASSVLQIAAMELLADHPEYHRAYVDIQEWWREHPETIAHDYRLAIAIERLIERTSNRN